jgi:invasion protein IalB
MQFDRIWILTSAMALCALGLTQAAAQDRVPPSRTVATFGNWSVVCSMIMPSGSADASADEEQCEMVSRVNVRGEDGTVRPLLQVSVSPAAEDGTARMLFQVPGNAYLRRPVALLVDPPEDQPVGTIPEDALEATFIRCGTSGCVADTTLSEDDQARLTEAGAAVVSFVNVSGSRVGVPLSMTGYEAGAQDMNDR